MLAWIMAGLMVGPLLYILVTLFTPRLAGVEDYQFGARRLNPADVVDSSIMYGLQVAAIALFATWGYIYGLAALIVPIFWIAGYFLFSWALSDTFLQRFAADTAFRTLHGFLADHNKARSVCITAALMTLVGLAGPAMFEAFTVGRSIAASVPSWSPASGAGLALAFLFVSLVYMIRSGFPGVVRLDQLQMTIGYGGFCAAFSGALILFLERVGAGFALWVSLSGLLAASVIAILKVRYDLEVRRYLKDFDPKTGPRTTADFLGITSILVGIISFGLSAAASYRALGSAPLSPDLITFASSQFSFGFTLLATVSLFIANALYQFVDVTQWQRLLSLAVDNSDLKAAAKILRGNVITGGVCSGMTWVIAVLFGVFLGQLLPGSDAYSLLSSFLKMVGTLPSAHAGILAFVFVAALVGIMFSTLDSLVAATSFTIQQDILGGFGGQHALLVARFVTVIVVAIQLAFYLAISALANDRVDAVLYICWSFQLAMVPIVVGLVIGRGGAHIARTLAMIVGCLGALTPLAIGSAEAAYELSPWLAVGTSSLVYLALGGWRRRPALTDTAAGAAL
ncbi:hypothetical protein [Brevundimonas sp. A19_0]|uniref:hypothetical protein n=1 Tax=Brevundimonas sp. A19_0 TaxID=2821087 RepID=UPI001ADAAC0C|nr:hypothetical protein [Brevundimonas sp. A19_0]MBO9501598.1 hypothetical protein [Brevundimonas sp. A19_0]